MFGFVDEAVIEVSSGHGGAGCVSFRREKYVPKGGPDGGDGGRGGDVVFVVRKNLKTLAHLKMKPHYHAENGRPGEGRKKHGRDGADAIVAVPPGTIIRDAESAALIKDLGEENEWHLLRGGRGGQGNSRFSTSRRQAPRFAQPGEEGVSVRLKIELNLIADIGFVGYPNAGKSTLLSVLTNANPRIGSWPFTTRTPNLGVLKRAERELVLADIPGLIEGASQGAGLGTTFLKHIARTRALLFLIDLSSHDVSSAFSILLGELRSYNPILSQRRRLVLGTKLDIVESGSALERLREALPAEEVHGISAVTGEGIDTLVEMLFRLVG